MRKKNKLIFIFLIISIIVLAVILFFNWNTLSTINDNIIEISQNEIKVEKLRKQIIENISSDSVNINEDTILDELFEEKVLSKESEKRNITIEKEQQEILKKVSYNNPISEENKQKISDMNMTEDEFRNYLYKQLINMQLRVNLKKQLLEEINNNNIKIDNIDFKAEVEALNNYKNSNTFNAEELFSKTQELLDEYISIIKNGYSKIEK